MTYIVNLNGRTVGRVQMSPGGVPYVDPAVLMVLNRAPSVGLAPMLPLLNPPGFTSILDSLLTRGISIPGLGQLTVQRLA